MKFLSVCSGIEAASVAWEPLGFKCIGVSEIEPFPAAVLKYHYPGVMNYGDLTQYEQWELPNFNVLVGGTPCQSFSIAGKRGGLDDPRGRVMLSYLGLAQKHRPEWIVWENVPGVLSSNSGRDFGTFIRELDGIGYRVAWRILDAQYFGVPQRRRRVFLVGNLRDVRYSVAVLFERGCMQRDSTQIRGRLRGRGKTVIGCLSTRTGACDRQDLEAMIYDYNNNEVRFTTPVEQERLQGFPDGHTNIPWRGKSDSLDSLRYKALGNSMAVPVMAWIGKRLKIVDTIMHTREGGGI